MCPPAAAKSADIDFFCTDEELYLCLERIITGLPLPQNVIPDVNPYQCMPENLPDGIWYFLRSKQDKNINFGSWNTSGEACRLFSNSSFTGWRITYEFYEGQAPNEHKTDWLMQEYWIIHKELHGNGKVKEECSLCRVLLGGEVRSNHEKRQKIYTNIASKNHFHAKLSINPGSNSNGTRGSASNPQDVEIAEPAVAEKTQDHHLENHSEMEYLSRGDFLELLDLDNPASPSSSSEASSGLTVSSDQCFDSLALLQDLECEISHGLVQKKDSACKLGLSASLRLNKAVMNIASESIVDGKINNPRAESIPRTDRASHEVPEDKVLSQTNENQKPDYCCKGTSLGSHNALASSSSNTDSEGERSNVGGMKNLKKYLCFMPF